MTGEFRNATLTTDRSPLKGPVDRPERSKLAEVRNAELLAAALAMIAGFIDAYGFITYGVYASFMSGNTTQAGYLAGQGAFAAAAVPALAILFFVGGSFAGTLLAQYAERDARRVLFGAVAVSLAAVVVFWRFGFVSAGAHIPTISFARGVMNSALSRVGAQSVSVTFITGTLSRVGANLALALRRAPLTDAEGPWDTHLRRALLLARVWLGFLVGALLSGAATPRYGAPVLLAPALILAVLAAFDRSDRGAAG